MFEFSRNVHCSIAKTVILLMIIHVHVIIYDGFKLSNRAETFFIPVQ